MTASELDLDATIRELDAIQATWAEIQNTPEPGLVTARLICAEQSAADVPHLIAKVKQLAGEVRRLRAYAETTRHHQQQHAEAVREVERLRAEMTAQNAVINAAKAWRHMRAESAAVRPKPEAAGLIAAVDALPQPEADR